MQKAGDCSYTWGWRIYLEPHLPGLKTWVAETVRYTLICIHNSMLIPYNKCCELLLYIPHFEVTCMSDLHLCDYTIICVQAADVVKSLFANRAQLHARVAVISFWPQVIYAVSSCYVHLPLHTHNIYLNRARRAASEQLVRPYTGWPHLLHHTHRWAILLRNYSTLGWSHHCLVTCMQQWAFTFIILPLWLWISAKT